ncbi:MAG TPA: hypothetical protein VMU24_10855 [Candidatus Acidoferrales bacterium]|nr:hypothetical protein [Candidatus Acidoferrales bacterium]
MNCALLQFEEPALDHSDRVLSDELATLQRIRQVIGAHPVELGELVKAIDALPGFAVRLCQMVRESGTECANVSEAAILAGRAGIRTLLDE